MNKRFTATTALFILVVFAAFFYHCGSGPEQAGEIIRPVRTHTVYAAGGERSRVFSGTIKAGQEARLSFKVPGTISRLHVKVGDSVKKGSLIAQLAPEDYSLRVQQAEAGLDQAKAQVLNARSAYERVRGLYENRNASKSDLDAARAAYESGNATLRSFEKQLEMARLQHSYTRLYAPVQGSIAGINAEVNENVGAGTPVVLLTGGKKLEVRVAIPESLITGIREGEQVSIAADALPGKALTGTIKEVGVASTSTGSTFPVTVQLDETPKDLRSGMSAEVTFRFKSAGKSKSIMVPAFAVCEDRGGRFVYTVKPLDAATGTIERKAVKSGDITGDGIEILSGLAEGDMVVTAGVSRIKPGQKVKLPKAAGTDTTAKGDKK